MNKSRLQELCQKEAWQLPEYNITKHVPDHNPRFSATVTINGLAFNTVESSKQAQNDAARLALDHFSTSLPIPNSIPKLSSTIQHVYKQQLLHYARMKYQSLPVYPCEWKGPAHNRRYRCTVTINGTTYQGEEFLPKIKDAEHAAAKVACISLLPIEQDDSGLCKSLLWKLLQTEGFHAPVNSTRISGEPHMPSFLSSVEIQGESFTGQEARNKNVSELSAAKVAYKTLSERKSSQIPMFPSLASQGQEASELLSSNAPSNMARPNTPPNSITREQGQESSVAVGTSHHLTTGLGTLTASGGSSVFGSVYGRVPKTTPSATCVCRKGSCSSDRDSTLEPPAKRSTTDVRLMYWF